MRGKEYAVVATGVRPGRPAPLGMSVGVVPCDPGATLEQLLVRADEAMYREKRARKALR